jgi:hypothetical protein
LRDGKCEELMSYELYKIVLIYSLCFQAARRAEVERQRKEEEKRKKEEEKRKKEEEKRKQAEERERDRLREEELRKK